MDKELKKGVKDEMEHTKSKTVAKKIAKDHLKKHSDYYSKLEKAGLDEAKKKEDWSNHYEHGRDQERANPHEMLGMSLQDMDDYRKEKKAKSKANAKVKTAERKKEPYLPFGKNALKHYKAGTMKLKEATLGGAKLAGKENPNNVKSKKSGFTINTKMNDAYSKVPDAKGLVRKRLLQKGKAAWNVGHAKKMAEAKETPEESKKKWDEMMKRIKHTREVTAHAGKMPKKDSNWRLAEENLHEVSKALLTRYMKGAKHQVSNTVVSDSKFEKRMDGMVAASKKLRKKKLAEGLKMGDYGHEKEKKDLAWRKKVQKEYDGPNREGKSADDGVRYTGD